MQRLNQSVKNVGEGSIVLNEIRQEFAEVKRERSISSSIDSCILFVGIPENVRTCQLIWSRDNSLHHVSPKLRTSTTERYVRSRSRRFE